MFFSYTASVVLVSLALYGLWALVGEFWRMLDATPGDHARPISLIVVVRDQEQRIEGIVRYLVREIEDNRSWCDVVILDHASEDLTPAILDRLAQRYPILKVVHLSREVRPVQEGLAFCDGDLIEVLDFVNRLSAAEACGSIRQALHRRY